MQEELGAVAMVIRALRDVEALLQEPHIGSGLDRRGLKASLALLAVQSIGAYLEGSLHDAAEDLMTVAEEMAVAHRKG